MTGQHLQKGKSFECSQSRVTLLPFAFGSSKQQSECSSVPHSQTVPSSSTEWEYSSPFKTNSIKSPLFTPGISSETEVNTTDSETEFYGEGGINDNDCVLVCKKNLADLFKTCQNCGQGIISKRTMNVGTKLVINLECVQGHEGCWNSCDDIRGMPLTNIKLASAIVFSGNTYQSFSSSAEVVDLQMFSKSTFNNIQNTYVLPVIDKTYQTQYIENIAQLIGETLDGGSVSPMGDGRSDSPGFSAKYTTYSIMDEATQKIVDMQLVQVTETTSSVAMEKEGFLRGMESLLHHGINIKTVTTDRSPSITKTMREEYGGISHQFDCWHICKGVKKQCFASGKKSGHGILLKWTKSITNHMWYACSICGGDADEVKRIWHSILYHVTGVHSWEDEDGTERSCDHEPLSQDEQESRMWFDLTSTVYRDLTNIVQDKNLNKDLEHLTLFKHTGELEAYH